MKKKKDFFDSKTNSHLFNNDYTNSHIKDNYLIKKICSLFYQFTNKTIKVLENYISQIEKEKISLQTENNQLKKDITLYLSIIKNLEDNEENLRDKLYIETKKNLMYVNSLQGFFQV